MCCVLLGRLCLCGEQKNVRNCRYLPQNNVAIEHVQCASIKIMWKMHWRYCTPNISANLIESKHLRRVPPVQTGAQVH